MGQHLQVSELMPPGFVVDEVIDAGSGIRICLRASSATSCCPGCGAASMRVHSRYARQLADLPLSGRPVYLLIRARRFHCDAVLCPRRIFTERFDNEALLPWSRRTSRLDQIIHHLGLALGGRPAAHVA
ncbi:transposase family protein [Ancylobacter sp. 6x-1]|uniref:Transposase family protein n=1 Tax=Ancylobacter crimeensis TaxID=2579147 RepID=A0ABT0DEZ6_9HYPH|nr:transposase family protein [Ancylobacter crimeensis]MCK0198516.1 transposase family protein [Ancylobacter crimeensis]